MRSTPIRNIIRNMITTCFLALALSTVGAPHPALAADDDAESESECDNGPTNKDWLLSLGGTAIGTVIVGMVGLSTLSRRLARGGHRQSTSNMAGMGLGAWVGGAAGASIMLASACGPWNVPGWIGVAVSAIGFIVMLFAIVTGKSD